MLHALCGDSNLRAREKRRKTSVQADSQGHVSPLSRAYDVLFGLSTLIFNRTLFHNLCEIDGFHGDVIRLQSQKSEVLRILFYTRLKINRK